MITKYASFEAAEVLDLKGTATRSHIASLDKIADFENYRTGDGYLYVRIRAISSRVNRNHDGWPSVELAGSQEIFDHHHSSSGFTVEASDGNPEYGFATFVGKPIFVDHHNSNPKKARGVIVDAKLNVLDHKTAAAGDSYWGGHDVDSSHLPPTEVELLLEVDANSFPRLAKAIVSGDLDGFSMGCDCDSSKCSHCGHIASSPEEYCSHILMKGAHHDYKTADGKRVSRKSYENCYGLRFFEISAVFEPADETALAREVRAGVYKEAELVGPGGLSHPDPIRQDSEVADLAMSLQMDKGVSAENAMEIAQAIIDKQRGGVPGHGEGETYQPKRYDYKPSDAHGMPKPYPGTPGFPPPERGTQPTSPWGEAVQQALNEAHPQRPVMNDWRNSATKVAENPLPQEMMVRAPEEIDTLRDEQLCPICGNDMDSETCQICGYVQPPKEFDNPDLDKAKQIRDEMKQQEEQQATAPAEGGQPGEQSPGAGGGTPGGAPANPNVMPTKAPATAGVKSDMHKWTPKVHPKTAARINQTEHPVNASNPPVSDEPKNEIVTKDQTKPVTSSMTTARQLIANAKRNKELSMQTRTADGPTPPGDTSPKTRVDVTGVGGVDEASNEAASKSDAQVDVTGIGTTGISDVAADKTESLPTADRKGDNSGFDESKTTEDSGPTKTFGDTDGQHSGVSDPVTNEPFPASEDGVKRSRTAYDDNTLEQNEQQGNKPVAEGGSAVQGVQPTDPVATESYKRVNLLEHQTSPANNSGPTDTWSGTDGNGVLKQQDPMTSDSQEWGGVTVPDVQLHTTGRISLAALRLAEAEVELGLIPREDRFNRMAELDAQDPTKVAAQLETLSRVKTAGLAKLAAQRQSGVTRLPKAFGKSTAAPNGFERIANDQETSEREPLTDDALDAGLFLR